MKDPIKVSDLVIDRNAISAVLREPGAGRVLIFLRNGRPIIMNDTLSAEEFQALTEKSE